MSIELLLAIAGLAIAAIGTYYTYRAYKKKQKPSKIEVNKSKEQNLEHGDASRHEGDSFSGDVTAYVKNGAVTTGSGKAISGHGQDSSRQSTINIEGGIHLHLGNNTDFESVRDGIAALLPQFLADNFPNLIEKASEFQKIVHSSSDPEALDDSMATISGMTADYTNIEDPNTIKGKLLDYSKSTLEAKSEKCPKCGLGFGYFEPGKCPRCGYSSIS